LPSLATLTMQGVVIVAAVEAATSFGRRLFGLIGRRPIGPHRALYLAPCRAVHTWFMRFPLDLVFLDQDLRVARIVRDVRPWRVVPGGRAARSVVELQSGWLPAKALKPGDAVALTPAT
jgi:uncharacterized protein